MRRCPLPTIGFALAARALCAAAPLAAQQLPDAPPGLVLLRGGKAQIGCDVASIERLMSETGEERLAAETPLFERELADFYVMVTELTNEQYEAYVRATGARPPSTWAKAALDRAQLQHVEREMAAREDAALRGKSYTPQPFDREAHWRAHWRELEWELETELVTLPVVQIDAHEAEAYAWWAGLRLMREEEFQYAGRGRSARAYPWGESWKPDAAATWERGLDWPSPVGSFPTGRTREGVADLCGNVWEWTQSPYTPFPGFRELRVDAKRGAARRAIVGAISWDPGWRVVVGGAFDQPHLAARLSTRMGRDPAAGSRTIGMRCALSAAPGLDRLAAVWERELGAGARARLVALNVEQRIAVERWRSEPGRSLALGYRRITDYEGLVWAPVERLAAGSPEGLASLARAQGSSVLLGLLHTTFALQVPKLRAGTYLIAWQPPGSAGAAALTPLGKPFPRSYDEASIWWLDAQGEALERVPAPGMLLDRARPARPARLVRWDAPESAPVAPRASLILPIAIDSSVQGKSFQCALELEVGEGVLDERFSGLQAR